MRKYLLFEVLKLKGRPDTVRTAVPSQFEMIIGLSAVPTMLVNVILFVYFVPLSFGPLYYPNVITPGQLDGNNDKFIIQFGDQSGKTPLDFGFKTDLKIFDRWGGLIYSSEDYQHDWSGASVSGGVYYFQVKVEDHSACKGWLQVIK